MDKQELKDRTQQFAVDIIRFVEKLPKSTSANHLGKQLLRAACAVGANYRAACRAQSYANFISKIGTVEEESDETLFWMQLLLKAAYVKKEIIKPLMLEANELTAIFTSTRITARKNIKLNKESTTKGK